MWKQGGGVGRGAKGGEEAGLESCFPGGDMQTGRPRLRKQVSFHFVVALTIHIDFGAQENEI